MKKLLYPFVLTLMVTACSDPISGDYGDTTSWKDQSILSTTEMLAAMEGKDSLFTTVSGEIKQACQAKGCWMSMDAGGSDMIVKFKDYGFFVPMNSANHMATIQGWAYTDTLSISDQIELAKDSEASEEEIASITAPKVKLTFMANGVKID